MRSSLFCEMFCDLDQGQFPDKNRLRGWFRAALTKKLAIISLPPAFWENDPKRNPDSQDLLWATVFLQDMDGFHAVRTIMETEKDERHIDQSVDERIKDGLVRLLQVVSGTEIENEVKNSIQFLTAHPALSTLHSLLKW